MANETERFFFPLKATTYSQYEYGECGLDDPPEEITPDLGYGASVMIGI